MNKRVLANLIQFKYRDPGQVPLVLNFGVNHEKILVKPAQELLFVQRRNR